MIPHPSILPEMRDLKIDTGVVRQVEDAETAIKAQLEALCDGRCVHDTALEFVGSALIATLRIQLLTPAAQWTLRQRCLATGWDEVEFHHRQSDDYGPGELYIALIEHKYPCPPRTLVKPPAGYVQD